MAITWLKPSSDYGPRSQGGSRSAKDIGSLTGRLPVVSGGESRPQRVYSKPLCYWLALVGTIGFSVASQLCDGEVVSESSLNLRRFLISVNYRRGFFGGVLATSRPVDSVVAVFRSFSSAFSVGFVLYKRATFFGWNGGFDRSQLGDVAAPQRCDRRRRLCRGLCRAKLPISSEFQSAGAVATMALHSVIT